MKILKLISIACVVLSLTSCDFFSKKENPKAIARVVNNYLYEEDIKNLISDEVTPEDSVLIVRNYIDRWASQKLLIEVSELNLSAEQKAEFDKLVSQYKIDLYTKAYLEQMVKRSIDTVISKEEVKQYYDQNKANFKTNTILAKLRYIKVPKEHQKINQIKEKFFNPKKTDQQFWDTYLMQLNSAAMNDSVWVDAYQIFQKVSFINSDNVDQYVQSGKKYEYDEGESMYFVKINAVLPENEISPLSYIEPTLRQIILNKRKLEFIKKIEKEITDDALKHNKYEIYK